MSLQVALLLIGGVVILIAAITAWDRARAVQRRREGLVPASGSGLELALDPPMSRRAGDGDFRIPQRGKEMEGDETSAHLSGVHGGAIDPPDDGLDFQIRLAGDQRVIWTAALAPVESRSTRFPVRTLGRMPDGTWVPLSGHVPVVPPAGGFDELIVAMQLADRQGAASEEELNSAAETAMRLADACGCAPEFSLQPDEAIDRAQKLHAFCAGLDLLATVYLRAPDARPFAGRDIERAAIGMGLTFGAGNVFHATAGKAVGGVGTFWIANGEGSGDFDPAGWSRLHSGTLACLMEVPMVPEPAMSFGRLVECAQALGSILGGTLCDRDGHPLEAEALEDIRLQIQKIEDRMIVAGLPPGGPRARRLFGLPGAT